MIIKTNMNERNMCGRVDKFRVQRAVYSGSPSLSSELIII